MGSLLQQALTESGFQTQLAGNGRDGLRLAPGQDLLIVDVMMPTMNGWQLVRELRDNAHRMPVLFLTARDSVADRVKGLDLGDDYLLKPFALEELFARVRALMRRAQSSQDVLQFDNLWLARRSHDARRGDRWLHLSQTEFAVLEMLVLKAGTPVPKSAILREVWRDDATRDDNIVEVYISYLRAKLEAMGGSRLIHTVRGAGYVLESRET